MHTEPALIRAAIRKNIEMRKSGLRLNTPLSEEMAEQFSRGEVRGLDTPCIDCKKLTVLACRYNDSHAEVYVCLNPECSFGFYN